MELLGIVCLIVTFCIIVQAQNNVFLSTLNIRNVLKKQMVVYALLSCALAFPMINGTFDLSNGAMAGIGGVIAEGLSLQVCSVFIFHWDGRLLVRLLFVPCSAMSTE